MWHTKNNKRWIKKKLLRTSKYYVAELNFKHPKLTLNSTPVEYRWRPSKIMLYKWLFKMKVNTREFLSLSVETKDSIVEDIIGLLRDKSNLSSP